MFVVFIHGPVASGKLTVARELAAMSGLPLFHNHLTIDLVLSLFPFGSTGFMALRERIWLDAFEAAAAADRSFIFTFAPERTVRPGLISDLAGLVERYGGAVHFVELTCPEDTIEQRLSSESRKHFGKLTAVDEYRALRAAGQFMFPVLPPPIISVPTHVTPPDEAARQIFSALQQVTG